MKLSLVLIIYRSNSSIALEASKFCEEVLKDRNIESIRIESDFHKDEIEKYLSNSESQPNIGIVLGGDGTFLKCANALTDYDIPLLSINIGGNLGFLTQEKEFLLDKSFVEIQKVITRVSKLANSSTLSKDILSTRDYVNTKLFEKDCELKVFEFIGELEKLFSEGYCNYLELLNLFEINVSTIEDLFDNEKGVLIMSEDLKIRNNRLNLLGLIRNYSLKIADFTLLNL